MKKFIFILFILVAQYTIKAQNLNNLSIPDGFKSKLENSKTNEDSVRIFLSISEHYRGISIDLRLKYAKIALEINKSKANELIASIHLAITKGYYNFANYDKMLIHLEIAEQAIKKITEKQKNIYLFDLYWLKADIFLVNSDANKALEYYLKAEKISETTNHVKNKHIFYIRFAKLYTTLQNQEKSAEYYIKAEKIAEKEGNQSPISASIYFSLASVYSNFEVDNKSIICYQKALAIYKNLKDTLGISTVYNGLGLLYSNQNKRKQAIKFYHEYLKYGKILNDTASIALAHNNIGYEYSLMGRYDSAEINLKKSIALSKEINDTANLSNTYHSLASTYLSAGKYENALEYFKLAEEYNKGFDIELECYMALDLSKVYLNIGKTALALQKLKQAEQIANTNNFKYTRIDILKAFSTYYSTINDYKTALFYENLLAKEDSVIHNELIDKELTNLNIKHSVENLENKITQLKVITKSQEEEVEKNYRFNLYLVSGILTAILALIILLFVKKKKKKYRKQLNSKNEELQKNNSKLQKMKEELIEINLSKDRFFNLIAFNLKKPFNYLLNYSEKIINEYDNLSKKQIIEYNKQINFTAQELFELLENLLYWSRLEIGKLSVNTQKHKLNEFIDDNLNWFKNRISSKGIYLKSILTDELFVAFDKILMSLVIRNLISNAIDKTNENGIVRISTLKRNNFVEISVEDNGKEIDNKQLEDIFSIKQVVENPTKSLGLVISNKIIQLHASKLVIQSKEKIGNRFSFKLDLN